MAIGESKGGGSNASAVKAGEAFFEVSIDDKGVIPSLKRFANRIASLGSTLRTAGLTAAGVGALALTPMIALMGAAIERADGLQEIAERFDETTESISALSFAADRAGIKFEELQDGFKKLDELTKRGLDGDGKALLALDQMGEDARSFSEMDLTGKLLTVADAFEGMNDPLERTQFLFNTFGDSARKFLPLVGQGSEELQKTFKRAAEVGDIVTKEQGQQAAKMKDAWDDTLKSIKNTLLAVGFAMFGFSESVDDGSESIVQILGRVREWMGENAGLIRSIAQIAAGLIAAGVAMFALGKAIGLLAPAVGLVKVAVLGGFAVIKAVVFAALTPIGLLVAGIIGVGAALLAWTDTGKEIRGIFVDTFNSIGATFREAWGGIVDAIKKGDLELAFEIAVKGLGVVWQQLLLGMMRAWQKFGRDLISGPLGKFHDFMERNIGGTGVTTDMISNVMDSVVKKQELEVARMRLELRALTNRAAEPKADAMPPVNGGDAAKRKKEANKQLMQIGDSVRGTFGSADYRGALGAGKANEYAKKANEELKKIKEELQKLNKKPGPMFM